MELIKDVQELLSMWSSYIQTCSKILVSVPKTMRHILYDFSSVQHVTDASVSSSNASKNLHISESPLQKDDDRISYIPFMVGKPTLEETKTVFEKCTTVIFKRIKLSSIAEGKDDTGVVSNAVDNDLDEIYASDLQFASNLLATGVSLTVTKSTKMTNNESAAEGLPKCKMSRLLIQACRNKNVTEVRHILKSLNIIKQYHPSDKTDGTDAVSTVVQTNVRQESGGLNTTMNGLLIDYIDNADDDDDEEEEDDNDDSEPTKVALNSTANIAQDEIKQEEDDSDIQWELEAVINLPDDINTLYTPLHIASELGYNSIIRLLLQYGADPCKVDYRSRTPYFLAKEKSTRDVFRKIRGVNESKWNWEKSGVGEGLTLEKESNKKEREKEKKRNGLS